MVYIDYITYTHTHAHLHTHSQMHVLVHARPQRSMQIRTTSIVSAHELTNSQLQDEEPSISRSIQIDAYVGQLQ